MIHSAGESIALIVLGIALGMLIYHLAVQIAAIIKNRNGGHK